MILVPVFAGRDHNEELYILYQEDENYLTRPFAREPIQKALKKMTKERAAAEQALMG